MDQKLLNSFILGLTIVAGLVALVWWLQYNPVAQLSLNVPGMDNRPKDMASDGEVVDIGVLFSSFDGVPSKIKGSWPGFRGAGFDNISRESVKLADSWPPKGPRIIWSVDLGEGHAGPVVADGRVFLLDYDEEQRADILRCFSFDNGKEIWRRGYRVYIKRNHGMSRTVPAVSGNHVVTIGPKCQVMCVAADSGDFIWGIDLAQKYKAEVPLWYTGQCPLIIDSIAVIAVGGTALMIGVDCATGEVVWETPNPKNWKMSHSSVMPFIIQGHKTFVYCAAGGVVGVFAEKNKMGQVMFETNLWDNNVTAPSPVQISRNRLFVTAGYGAGSMVLKINGPELKYQVEAEQKYKSSQGLASEQQTPIYYKGHLFSILPKDAGPNRNQFVCSHPRDGQKFLFTSGKTNRFGLGPYIVADNKFYILSDEGVLTMARADSANYTQLAQTKILSGVDAWGPMALVAGRLLARDSHKMVCVDLRPVSGSGG